MSCCLLVGVTLQAQEEPMEPAAPPVFKEGQLIVKFKKGKQSGEIDSLNAKMGTRSKKVLSQKINAHLVEVPAGQTVESMIAKYRKSGEVDYAEPDYEIFLNAMPNDPSFLNGTQWALHNTGQMTGAGIKIQGVVDVDIDAPEAWDIQPTAEGVVVAVIDTGIRYTHQDLKNSMWKNTKEIPGNGIDDDQNGYKDDVYGINAITNTGNPMDDHGHGSHCAGVIGASSNDGVGMAGIAPKVKLMACKFLSKQGSGNSSDAIECVEYARKMGAHLMSNSWGGGGYSQALFDAIDAARKEGIIFVAAAGNDGKNMDVMPHYPSSYLLDNVVAVGAHGADERITSFSNYGSGMVNLLAPGLEIFSCLSKSDTAYGSWSGTSMATPQVAGALALMKAHFPSDSYNQLINRMYRSVDIPTDAKIKLKYNSSSQSKGRLNAAKALVGVDTRPLGDNANEAISLAANGGTGRTSNQYATKESWELNHGGVVGGHSVWFKWTARADGVAKISTQGSSIDTVLAVYTSTSTKVAALVSNDDADGGKTSRVSFPVQAGKAFMIAVDGKNGETGTVAIHADLPPANDDFVNRQLVSGSSALVSLNNIGASAEFGEAAKAGDPASKSLWYSWVAPTTGNYLIETFKGTFDTVLGVYEGDALASLQEKGSNDDLGTSGSMPDRQSKVMIAVVAGTNYQISVDGYAGNVGDTYLRIYAEGSVAPAPPATPPPVNNGAKEVIVAPSQGGKITVNGAWKVGNGKFPGGYTTNGYNQKWDNYMKIGRTSKSIMYQPLKLKVDQKYEVFVWSPISTSFATNTPMDILHSGVTTTVVVDQKSTGGGWVSVGTYTFKGDTTDALVLRNDGTDGTVVDVAVRFTLVP